MSFWDSLMYSSTLRGNPAFARMEADRMGAERDRRYLMEDVAANRQIYDQAYGPGGLMEGFAEMTPQEQVARRTQLGNLAGMTSPLEDTRRTYGGQYTDLSEPMTPGGGKPTSQMKNWAFRDQLVQQFGESSPEVRRFDNWVAREQWLNVGPGYVNPLMGGGGAPPTGGGIPAPVGAPQPSYPDPILPPVDPASGEPLLEPGEVLSPDSPLGVRGATPGAPAPQGGYIPRGLNPGDQPEVKGAQRTETGRADFQTKQMGAFADAASAARRNLIRLNQLEGHLARSGSGLGPTLQLLAADWGIEVGEGVDELQAARAIINAMVPAQRPPGSGPMSDADLELFKQSLPRIINQPGGNKLIIDTLKGIAEYDINLGQISAKYMTGDIDYREAQRQIDALKNPLENLRGEPAETPAQYGASLQSAAQAELQRRREARKAPVDRRRYRGAR